MLRPTKGNMYDFVTHTWNPIKGKCSHGCSYCYMKRWGEQKPVHLDEREMKTDLGEGNFIFVGSSTDMFAQDVPDEWIERILEKTFDCKKNKYLFQTKNPLRYHDFLHEIRRRDILCTTIESNRMYDGISKAPDIQSRMDALVGLGNVMVTVEPILDFDLAPLMYALKQRNIKQVNIGADSGNNHLPEPPADKVRALIAGLEEGGIKVVQKKNLGRLIK